MTRLLAFLAVVAVLSAAAAWIADRPGAVSLRWQGWQVDTSVAVLVLAIAVLGALVAAAYNLYRWLVVSPRTIRRFRTERRRQRGYRALTRGLVSAAAGDAPGARAAARDAEALLGEPPLTLLLTAQAAQLDGDSRAAGVAFRRMLEHDQTEFLGLRGLLVQAVRKGDAATALTLARRAYQINPDAAWVLDNLIQLESAAGNWDGAETAVASAVKARRLAHAEGARKRALFDFERARAADAAGDSAGALGLAKKALAKEPDLVPAIALAARLMIARGQARGARRLIERSWPACAHPDLARAYAAAAPDGGALAKVKALERLVDACPGEVEGHVALAGAAIEAGLWGTARNHLGRAEALRESAAVFRLRAELEEAETGDVERARSWWRKAAEAPPDPVWLCRRCGAPAGTWTLICAACGAVDSLAWRTPPVAAVVADPLLAPAPAAALRIERQS
ncbi:MAG TPA: heme biosynthesis HemY N-terminal domain-containing protein [Alphaproteobacteria bacterium]